MTSRFFPAVILLCLVSLCLTAQSTDSLIYAEGKVINAATKELISARITYQSLPYGNKVGVINNNTYSFPMFDGEKYSIMVEAAGFAPAKYMLDPAEANAEKKVVRDIELSNSTAAKPNTHVVGHVMRLNNLIFEVGNSKIDPESYPELDLVVNMMKENPTMVIQLEGHTDYVGAASDNMKLSQRRVESVKSYVASKGIQKSRMKTKAFGGTQPISRDNTPEAHRLNRRVEVRILQN
jgi:outer membrane protein OmpA-like peptidoglycan-associated protein